MPLLHLFQEARFASAHPCVAMAQKERARRWAMATPPLMNPIGDPGCERLTNARMVVF